MVDDFALCYLAEGEGYIDHVVDVGLFLVEEGDAAVFLEAHGGVGGTGRADLQALGPILGKGGGGRGAGDGAHPV